jgi:thiamine biosynthesis lipoprotein
MVRLAGTLFVALLAALALPDAARAGTVPFATTPDSLYHQTRPLMGTTAEVLLYAPDGARASELFEAAFAEMERVETALSSYRSTSEISRINREGGEGAVTTDPETFGLLQAAMEFSAETGGAFDMTVGPLMAAWGFLRGEGRRPEQDELAWARRRSGWQKVVLDPESRSVRFLIPGMALDMGGMGKGWALDRAGTVLRELGVEAALLGLGQSSYLALGAPPESVGWIVTVPDPDSPQNTLSEVLLRHRALSTSGSREKYFELDGQRYGHIIDPRTGMPSTGGTIQVTVTAETAMGADMLSTALFVLGPEEGRWVLEDEPSAHGLVVNDGAGESRVVPLRWPWVTVR